ncbi:MAG: peptide chain release factor 1 [Chloroflexota bacterium]
MDTLLEKITGIEARYEELNQLLMEIGNDYERAAELNKERIDIEPLVDEARQYRRLLQQLDEARTILDQEEDEELRTMATVEINELKPEIERLEASLRGMLVPKDPRDAKNVFVEVRAGTGGDEAALFAADLYRMYTRYAERVGWKYEVISQNEIGIGGYKEIIFEIRGHGAFSRLKYESGVHRVQRVPTTESSGRIHTSTATVAVLAEVEEVDIVIPESDLRIDVYRSAGAGGQSVQKNATAIRMTHVPTGIAVACQDERSQLQNKLRAMSILRARLYDIEEQKRQSEIDEARRSQVGSGERSEKIRTYNYPQSRVTDHRINLSNFNLPTVMQGYIDEFIDELTTSDEAERLASAGIDDED